MTLPQAQVPLAAKELCAHRVWQRGEFKDLKGPLAEYMEQSAVLYNILVYSLRASRYTRNHGIWPAKQLTRAASFQT